MDDLELQDIEDLLRDLEEKKRRVNRHPLSSMPLLGQTRRSRLPAWVVLAAGGTWFPVTIIGCWLLTGALSGTFLADGTHGLGLVLLLFVLFGYSGHLILLVALFVRPRGSAVRQGGDSPWRN